MVRLCCRVFRMIADMLQSIGIDNVIAFDYIEKPPLEAFNRALSHLWLLGALTHEGKLSDLGNSIIYNPQNLAHLF